MQAASSIEKFTVRPVIVPLARPIRTAVGEIPSAPLILIDVAASGGVAGRAYVFAYTTLVLKPLVQAIESLGGTLIGKTLAPSDRMADLERTLKLLGRQGIAGMAVSGIDMALWDALARSRNMALAEMLGGSCRPIPAYDSFGIVGSKKDIKAIEASVAAGFRAIKIKIGGGSIADDVRVVADVRQAIGSSVRLMIDYNQSLDAPEALKRAAHLAEFDIDWIEEPVPADDLVGHAAVRSRSPIRVQTGENWWFPAGMATALAMRAADFAMPDASRIGGVTGWRQAAGMAEAASIPMSSHALIEVSAHLLAVTPTVHWLEHLDKARVLVQAPYTAEDGMLAPKGPGIGLDWDEKAVARYAA